MTIKRPALGGYHDLWMFLQVARVAPQVVLDQLDDRYISTAAPPSLWPPSSDCEVDIHADSAPWLLRPPDEWSGVVILGDPGLVVLTAWSDGLIEVDEVLVTWPSPDRPHIARRGDPMLVAPLEVVADENLRSSMLLRLITDAARRRRARFRTCGVCGDRNPPEWMDNSTRCMGCAERAGVVY